MPLTGKIYGVTVGATAAVAIPGAAKRYALTLIGPSAGSITVSSDPNPTAGNGIVLTPNQGPVHLCRTEYGTLLESALYAIADAAGRVLGVAESYEL